MRNQFHGLFSNSSSIYLSYFATLFPAPTLPIVWSRGNSLDEWLANTAYSLVPIEATWLLFGTFLAGWLWLHWAGYNWVKVSKSSHVASIQHWRIRVSGQDVNYEVNLVLNYELVRGPRPSLYSKAPLYPFVLVEHIFTRNDRFSEYSIFEFLTIYIQINNIDPSWGHFWP